MTEPTNGEELVNRIKRGVNVQQAEIERLQKRVAVLEMVLDEEIAPSDCRDVANEMIVQGIHDQRNGK